MKYFTLIALLVGLFSASSSWAVPTALTVQSVTEAAAVANYQSCDNTNGNKFANQQEDVLLLVWNNGSTGSATVTITAQTTSIDDPTAGTVTKSSQAISLSTTQMKILGPFPKKVFNDSSGFVNLTISGTGAADVDLLPIRSSKLYKTR